MEKYLGVKEVFAKPMTLGEYNKYRNWKIPNNENLNDPGYLVEYLNGGKANHPNHDGYISWSPANVFEKSYRKVKGLTFGQAIEALRMSKKVTRSGWNGKGQYLLYVKNGTFQEFYAMREYIAIMTIDHTLVPWVASQTDILAEDWSIIA